MLQIEVDRERLLEDLLNKYETFIAELPVKFLIFEGKRSWYGSVRIILSILGGCGKEGYTAKVPMLTDNYYIYFQLGRILLHITGYLPLLLACQFCLTLVR